MLIPVSGGYAIFNTNQDIPSKLINEWPQSFPAAGYRNASSGSLDNQGTNVYYWGAPRTTGAGYYANFNSSNANTANTNNGSRAYGLRVLRQNLQKVPLFYTAVIKENQLLTDLFRAYFDARKNKRTSRSQIAFEVNLEHNIVSLFEEIEGRTYKPSPCVCFISHYPVKREVFASQFRDRVVHHLLYNYLLPVFEPKMIYDSYSCRVGKGSLFGVKRLEHHMRSCSHNYTKPAYVLKLDLKGYFMSIPRQRLFDLIVGKLPEDLDNRDLILFLLGKIIFNDPTENCTFMSGRSEWKDLPKSKSLFSNPEGIGLPIGDLTSQLFSNIYLNELDHYMKRTLKCTHYGRYVDDFYIVDESARRLREIVPQVKEFLRKELHLTLHPNKIYLQPVEKGILFLGAYVKPFYTLPSKRTIGAFKRSVKEMDRNLSGDGSHPDLSILNSYLGYLSHFNLYHMTYNILMSTKKLKHLKYSCGFGYAKI